MSAHLERIARIGRAGIRCAAARLPTHMGIGVAWGPAALDTSGNAVDAAVAFGREAVAAGLDSLWS
ncbi:hypothetical protein [Nocardia puris]|uniref:Uncharacterized protein n=1 Tax=Nocardia puris TaxID=208602 RepID=A0A366DH27_9NOCA|nr:hypothetical protein [Nocardia puris]RBO89382.1 hypothetical protein DFR74_10759 [Nocardia puris]